jgi:RNA polymerase sigma-70 factor (ECF subfamily)
MVQVASGDRGALATLIQRHQRFVLATAYRFLGDRAEAEDTAQEVFLRLWASAGRYRPETELRAYLRTITVHFCLDLKRKARLMVLPGDREVRGPANPHRDLEAAERQDALELALQTLPSNQRMAVILFHLEGLSVREVSDLLDTSPKSVESLLSRARTGLRERLGRLLGEM